MHVMHCVVIQHALIPYAICSQVRNAEIRMHSDRCIEVYLSADFWLTTDLTEATAKKTDAG